MPIAEIRVAARWSISIAFLRRVHEVAEIAIARCRHALLAAIWFRCLYPVLSDDSSAGLVVRFSCSPKSRVTDRGRYAEG